MCLEVSSKYVKKDMKKMRVLYKLLQNVEFLLQLALLAQVT